MLLALTSDTHLPRGTRRLPQACIELCRDADLIIHAGDFVATEVLRQLESYGRVLAVHGNVDAPALRRALPERLEIELAPGLMLGLVHDAGVARGRLARMRRRFPRGRAVVFGHSHIPMHESAPDGFQIFNPGSPTDRRRAPHHTMGLARVSGAAISFELLELD